jgi:hypothetical protein
MYVNKTLPLSDTEISYGALEETMIGFFGYNAGTITNLHLASGGLSVDITPGDTNKKELYGYSIGTICGQNSGQIAYCSNSEYSLYLHIEPSDETANFYVGGIAGKNESVLLLCINNSKIEVIDNKGSGDLRIGGISGLNFLNYKKELDSNSSYSNLNRGDLSVRTEEGIGGRTHGIGGLVGEYRHYPIIDEKIITSMDSYNSGTITYTIGTEEYEYAVGGIVGIIPKEWRNLWFANCYNIGEMYISYYGKRTTSNKECIGWVFGRVEDAMKLAYFRYNELYYDDTTAKKEGFIPVNRPVGNFTEEYINANEKETQEVLSYILRFSEEYWPTWVIQKERWGDRGDWNNGNPVYPKLWIEVNK